MRDCTLNYSYTNCICWRSVVLFVSYVRNVRISSTWWPKIFYKMKIWAFHEPFRSTYTTTYTFMLCIVQCTHDGTLLSISIYLSFKFKVFLHFPLSNFFVCQLCTLFKYVEYRTVDDVLKCYLFPLTKIKTSLFLLTRTGFEFDKWVVFNVLRHTYVCANVKCRNIVFIFFYVFFCFTLITIPNFRTVMDEKG